MRSRVLGRVLMALALLAVTVALTGLYAVGAWLARQRQREAALRVALGAPQASVALLLARGGVVAVAAGLAIGWLAAAPMAALLASELRGVPPSDLTTRAIVATVLATVSLASLWRPAWRAASWNLAGILRAD